VRVVAVRDCCACLVVACSEAKKTESGFAAMNREEEGFPSLGIVMSVQASWCRAMRIVGWSASWVDLVFAIADRKYLHFYTLRLRESDFSSFGIHS